MERQEQSAVESGPIGGPEGRAAALNCWRGPVELEPLERSISNHNFVATGRGEPFVVRIGDDIPAHGVSRFNENGRAFSAAEVRRARNLSRILELVRRCHTALAEFLRDPLPRFRVFEVARLWLIDWEYAGYNSGLFDLGNISANSTLSPGQEEWLLEVYYGPPVGAERRRRDAAMKCASALREALWSAVSETYLALDIDYVAYTDRHLGRFEQAYEGFQRLAAPSA